MKNINILILTLILLLTACDDYVDLTPKGLIIPETVEELEKVLGDDYKVFLATHINDYLMNDDAYVPASQVSTFQGRFIEESARRSYQLMDYFYLDTENDRDWDNNYELIGISNYVIGRLGSAKGSQLEKDKVHGQALVYRAFSYLDLVNLYAQHYAVDDPNTPGSGVPLITEFGDPNVSVSRASIQEVYDLITADLTEALTLLKEDFSMLKYKPTKVVAYSLLARTYLHMGKYDLAISNASSALDIQGTLTNYPTILPELEYTLGDYGVYGSRDPAMENLTEIIMAKGGYCPYYFTLPDYNTYAFTYVTPEAIDLYDQDHDTRFTDLITFDDSAQAYRWTGTDQLYGVAKRNLTVSEVLLIRAESNARLGNINEAMDDLNALRAERFNTDDPTIVNLTADTQTEAIQHVLEERRRELLYQGTRFFDIKRLNAIDNAGIGIERLDLQGNSISLPAGDPRWAIAIPPKEVALRQEMKQNPR